MRRKIVIVASWFPSANDPVSGVFVRDQALALAERYDVSVVAPQHVGWASGFRGRRQPIIERVGSLTVHRDVCLRPRLARWLLAPTFLHALHRALDRMERAGQSPDLLHAHVVLPAGWAARRAGDQRDLPVVLTEHSGPFSVHLRTPWQRWLVRDAMANGPVLAVSPSLQQAIIAAVPSAQVAVVGNLVATRFFTPGPRQNVCSGRTRLLCVALLTQEKGVQYLLEAAVKLVGRGINGFEIEIGGDGSDRVRLEQLAARLGLADRCRFLGLLSREQVRERMQHCDAFILPSLGETFGLVLGEAMACGKPVIATRCGGPEFVVDDATGVLVPPADSAALADAIARFIHGQAHFDPVHVRASVVRRFGEAVFLDQMTAVYERAWAARDRG
jgi:glycosyltransferase involved in cell wall biosynthesis